jgi:NADH:ubiquinone oxidoreductase subunit 3 (subunit A)
MANPFNKFLGDNERLVLKAAHAICNSVHKRMEKYEDDVIPIDPSRRYECGKTSGKIVAYSDSAEYTLKMMLLLIGE